MAHITIIRHAEAEGNYYRRAHGQYDSLVTPNGEAQIGALRERFRDVTFDAVYTSDMYRTRRTSSALRTLSGAAAVALPALREIHLGDWEDVPWGELAACDAKNLAVFTHEPGRFGRRGPSGESMGEARARIFGAVRQLAKRHTGERIAIVSHGLVIRALLAALKGLPPGRLHEIPHCDNTAVTRVVWDGVSAPRVLVHGDNVHLGELSTLGRQHWWRKDSRLTDTNLWFQPAILPRDLPRTLRCLQDAWQTVYGTMNGFNDEISNAHTERMAAAHKRAVMFVMRDDRPVGLLQLDTEMVSPDNTGHVALIYLSPDARGRELGAQLVGHAVSVYRALGREALHLRVAESNRPARRLYEKVGFLETGRETGQQEELIVMKMGISIDN